MNNTETSEFGQFLEECFKKSECTILCFDRGELYTLYNQDAILVCNEYFGGNLNQIRTFTANVNGQATTIRYVNIRKTIADVFFQYLLLKKHYRVEIFSRQRNSNEWKVEFRASPGNLSQFEDILFPNGGNEGGLANGLANSVSQCVLSLKLTTSSAAQGGDLNISVALCDNDSREMKVCEFSDTADFYHLMAFLAQIDCYECLLPASPPSASSSNQETKASADQKMRDILKRAGILVTPVKKDDFSPKDALADLNYLLKTGNNNSTSSDNDTQYGRALVNSLNDSCLSCLAAIFKFLKVKEDDVNKNAYRLTWLKLEGYVRLDSVALASLNLIPAPQDTRFQSVFGVLNYCRTPQGQRLLMQWIRQPLTDKQLIEERLDLVEIFHTETEICQTLFEDFLRRMPDMHRLGKKLEKSKSSLQDCYRLYLAVKRSSQLSALLQRYEGPHQPVLKDYFLSPLLEMSENLTKFTNLIEETMDLEAVKEQEFIVRADFDDNLKNIKDKLDTLTEKIEKEYYKIAKMIGLEAGKNVKLDCSEMHGHALQITTKEEVRIRNVSSVSIIDTTKNRVKFRSSLMTDYSDKYQRLKEDYNDQQQGIVEEILNLARGYSEVFHKYNALLANLDVCVSLAKAAMMAPRPYVRPKILPADNNGRIHLIQCRHPCLEMQEDVAFIPNDYCSDKGMSGVQVITGPNMGGKSTYIRSVAIAVLMAQMGSFVPCDSAEISLVDGVMTRVGSHDSQMLGVSTFLTEMLEASYFLSTATQNSLIIIDELGRGTSTYDGFGLAWSISRYLAQEVKCFCLFATHFHELTKLAEEMRLSSDSAGVCNLQVEATICDNELVMLHKVVPGICSQSFGIHVAKMAKLPPQVISRAEQVTKEFEALQILSKDDFVTTHGEKPAKRQKQASKEYLKELQKLKVDFCKYDLSSPGNVELARKELFRQLQERPMLQELAALLV